MIGECHLAKYLGWSAARLAWWIEMTPCFTLLKETPMWTPNQKISDKHLMRFCIYLPMDLIGIQRITWKAATLMRNWSKGTSTIFLAWAFREKHKQKTLLKPVAFLQRAHHETFIIGYASHFSNWQAQTFKVRTWSRFTCNELIL